MDLFARILRDVPLAGAVDDLDEPARGVSQVLGGQRGIVVDPPTGPQVGEHLLEEVLGDPEDHVAVHLDEAAVGIPGEVIVSGPRGQQLRRPRR